MVAALTFAGCVGSGTGIPIPLIGKKSDPLSVEGTRASTATASAASSGAARLSPARPSAAQTVTSPRDLAELVKSNSSTKPSAGSRAAKAVSASLRRAKDALTFSPRVIPAADPTRLDYEAGAIGADVFISSARVFAQRGDSEKALAQYRKALEAEPGNRAALIGYARLSHRQGNFDEAIESYKSAIEKYPEDAVALNDLGLCYARQGQLDQAIAMLARAVQAQPDSRLYRNNIATVLVEANRVDEALGHLEHVHGRAVAHYNLGVLFQKRGRDQEALANFSQAAQLDPTLGAARAMMAQLQSAPPPVPSPSPVRHGTTTTPISAFTRPAADVTDSAVIPSPLWAPNTTYPSSSPQTAAAAPAPVLAPNPPVLAPPRPRTGPFGHELPRTNATPVRADRPGANRSRGPAAARGPSPQAMPQRSTEYNIYSEGAGTQDQHQPQLLPPIVQP
jgi:tetratricopeptide (TPR) repeat protein